MMARHDPKGGANRLVRDQTLQKQQRAPVGPRAPLPDEEDPKKKCKNCGAFGHTDRDTKCFMKRWKEALIPQNFGKKEGKENLKPRKSQGQGNPGPLNKEKGEKAERPRLQDPQRKALLPIFSGKPLAKPLPNRKESMESCDYLRVATRPMPVPTSNKRPRVDPALTDGSATKMSDTVSVFASLTAPSFPSPEKPGAFLAHSPHVTAKSEAPCVPVPLSGLYEDLQVSSSSEDSDNALERDCKRQGPRGYQLP
ncbi:PREDICTED: protein FAM90A1-like [Mandrillus leucophaeus]|uniref:protein FAM90A1-like n=1 Tax=Mandrillus leucophaeus TaxID=9568 RepID=UPI0005F52A89|nr:PREDICTED: protein FAM90A1-like [Mandrillus leucophaeus]